MEKYYLRVTIDGNVQFTIEFNNRDERDLNVEKQINHSNVKLVYEMKEYNNTKDLLFETNQKRKRELKYGV